MSSNSFNTINVWSNDFEHNSFKAFYSALKLENDAQWIQVNKPEAASLWCLVEVEENSEILTKMYETLTKPPTVLYLAKSFTVAPVSSWVFFRSPVNVTALHKWLKFKFIDALSTEHAQVDDIIANAQPLWKTLPFKLKYWPNVTDYSDDLSVVNACSIMLRDWITFDKLTALIDSSILSKMLTDMDKQGGIEYQPQSSILSNSDNQIHNIDDSGKDAGVLDNEFNDNNSGMGFFKKLFNRYKN